MYRDDDTLYIICSCCCCPLVGFFVGDGFDVADGFGGDKDDGDGGVIGFVPSNVGSLSFPELSSKTLLPFVPIFDDGFVGGGDEGCDGTFLGGSVGLDRRGGLVRLVFTGFVVLVFVVDDGVVVSSTTSFSTLGS